MLDKVIFDAKPIEDVADAVADALEPGALVAVEGPPGSGRHLLTHRIASHLDKKAIVVGVPPSEDPDGPLHVLLQAAAALGPEAVKLAENGSLLLVRRAWEIIREIALNDRVLILQVPAAYALTTRPLGDSDPTEGWLGALVRRSQAARTTLLLVVPQGEPLPRAAFKRFTLRKCEANLDSLDDAALWGDYGPAAARLRVSLGNPQKRPSPLQLRLMVGLVGLGVPASSVAETARRAGAPGSLTPFARELVSALSRDGLGPLRDAVRRLALARRPLPVAKALELAAPPRDHEALLRYCIGYGDPELRVPDVVRNVLKRRLPRLASEAADHKRVADHHATLDGAYSASEAAQTKDARQSVGHWLEKVHHLAHSGSLGQVEWEKQNLRSREFLIDRARALSVEQKDYKAAAELYGRCLQLWPKDPYALHYRGYNLDRDGGDPVEIEECYRNALHSRKTNLFNNSRLITFLIGQGRPLDAEQAWENSLVNLIDRPPELVAHHVTFHVVNAWLDAGDVRRARKTFDLLPLDIERDASIERLEQRLLDAEEAMALGVSVYPPDVPMAERWAGPRVAQPSTRGRRLERWFPGQVVASDAQNVTVALATPDQEPANRRVFSREIPAKEWLEIADWAVPSEAKGYVEVGEYEGGVTFVFSVPAPPSDRRRDEDERPHPLRYLMREVSLSPVG